MPVTIQYMSASSESDMSKDSLDINDDEYYDSYNNYDDEDDFAEFLSFGGDYQNHNLNIGSVEQPWTVYLERMKIRHY